MGDKMSEENSPAAEPEPKKEWPVYEPPARWYIQQGQPFGENYKDYK